MRRTNVQMREAEQRALAVLYLQPDGMLTDAGGYAILKLGRYAAVPMTSSQAKTNVNNLVKQGLLIKDSRPFKGGTSSIPRRGGGEPIEIEHHGCFAVMLAVEKDELISRGALGQEYIDELKKVIDERMTNKMAKRQKQAEEKVIVRSPRKQPEPVQETLPMGDDPAMAVADALLRKVIEMANQPRVDPNVIQGIRERHSEEVLRLQHNIETLTKSVNELAEENEKLKKAAANVAGRARRGETLSSSIRDLVGADVWEKLKP